MPIDKVTVAQVVNQNHRILLEMMREDIRAMQSARSYSVPCTKRIMLLNEIDMEELAQTVSMIQKELDRIASSKPGEAFEVRMEQVCQNGVYLKNLKHYAGVTTLDDFYSCDPFILQEALRRAELELGRRTEHHLHVRSGVNRKRLANVSDDTRPH